MRNIKLLIEYDGTRYTGWQNQKNSKSVQEIIEKGLHKLTKERIKIKGASRTDAGVHALGQVANFKIKSKIPVKAFKLGLNNLIPYDIVIMDAKDVKSSFDPIICAKKKHYRYCIKIGESASVITARFSWNISKPLDIKSMKKAAKKLLGFKDFKSFQAKDLERKTTRRKIYSIKFSTGPLRMIFIDFKASGFLKYMVRNIVGTLVEIGKGRMNYKDIEKILSSKDRKTAGPTAPACGLFLIKVYY